jgi:uncharacterized membrane protein YgcG
MHKKELIELVVVVFVFVSTTVVDGDVTCDTALDNTTDSVVILEQLLDWCILDQHCSNMYYQSDSENSTVFKFMIRHIIRDIEQGLEDPLRLYICNTTYTEALKYIWTLILKARRDEVQVCDINHHYVVSLDELKGECVCDHHRLCTDEKNDVYLLKYLAIILVVIGFMLLAINVYSIFAGLRLYSSMSSSRSKHNITGGGGSSSGGSSGGSSSSSGGGGSSSVNNNDAIREVLKKIL